MSDFTKSDNFYEILGLSREAKEDEIKKAYRKLAAKWHPDKHKTDKHIARQKFIEIARAYETLSNPQQRILYDKFGESSVNKHHFGAFNINDAFHTFENFSKSRSTKFASYDQQSDYHEISLNDEFFTQPDIYMQRRQMPIEIKVDVTLEELFHGCEKKIQVHNPDNNEDSKILTLTVEPGSRHDTIYTFVEAGFSAKDAREITMNKYKIPSDVYVILNEINLHIVKSKLMPSGDEISGELSRKGSDLIYDLKLTKEQLECNTVMLFELFGDNLNINIPNTHSICVKNFGMPLKHQKGKRGNLYIENKIFSMK